jgi:hypothetical protein
VPTVGAATVTKKNGTIASILVAIFLVVAALIDLRIAAAIAAVYLIGFAINRVLSKRRKQ